MLNRAILIGNLGRDVELRYTQGGDPVANFSVATTYRSANKEETEWHEIVCFQRQAEVCAQHLRKGRLVYLEGRIHKRKWEDKDGRQREKTEIVAELVRFLNGGRREE